MYKLFCSECETRFKISDNTLQNFIEDESSVIDCPECHSIEVNLLEVEGQNAGY